MIGGIGRRPGPERGTGLQHQVERLGADAAIGVEKNHHPGTERRGDDLADRAADRQQASAMSAAIADDADISRIWPPTLNGTATAPAITSATMMPSSRMPNTRQKSLRTSLNDRLIASTMPSRSSTMIDGVKRQHRPHIGQRRKRAESERDSDDDRGAPVGANPMPMMMATTTAPTRSHRSPT